jgi:hypothetical protein
MPGTSSCGTLAACGRFRAGGKMARSGRGDGEPPQAIAAEGSSSPAPRPRASGLDTKMTWGLIGLGLVGHMLRSPRFYETVAVTAIAVGSLRQIGQQSRANTMARLAAWNKREMQRLEHKAQRQARAVKGATQMAQSGPPWSWPDQVTRPGNQGPGGGRGPARRSRRRSWPGGRLPGGGRRLKRVWWRRKCGKGCEPVGERGVPADGG